MNGLKTTVAYCIKQKVIKNLLLAHERIAEDGSGRDMILLSKYLMKLADQCGNVLVDAIPESKEQRG